MKNLTKPVRMKKNWTLLLLAFASQLVLAQYTISGPTTVNINDVRDYAISGSGPGYGKTVWNANGGTIISETLSTVRIRWTQAGTNRRVNAVLWYYPVDSSPEAYPSLKVTVNSNDPPIKYTLSNNGPSEVCTNIGSVRLSDSQSGATYRLYRNGSSYGSARSGTNNAMTWSSLPAGSYAVRATLNGQSVNMNGSVTIGTKTAAPIVITPAGVSDINNVCPNEQIILSSNGTLHTWTNVNGYITGQNPAYVVLSNGQSKTVTVTATNECGVRRTASITLRAASAIGTVSISSGVSTRCKGSGTTDYNASASNASSYTWAISPSSAGSINTAGTVSWNASYAGNATITATARNSCSQSRSGSRTVTVRNPPTAYAMSAPSSVCSTGTVTLADSQSGVNYQLFRNNTASGSPKAGTGLALTWTGMSPATYRIQATYTNGICGAVAMANQVTIGAINPTTVTISTSESDINNICPGTTVTLGTNGSGPNWSGVDTSGTVATVTLAAGQSRTVSVSATNNCGELQSASITLRARGAIGTVSISSGVSTRCKGSGTTDYNASASNASSYTWAISPSGAGTINASGTVNWNASYAGNATITATARNSCNLSRSGSRTVTVKNPPTAYSLSAPASVCTTGTVTLADSQSGVTYQLFRNNTASGSPKVGTGSALLWTGVSPATYRIEATNTDGTCSTIAMANQVTIGATAASPIAISVGVANINVICAGTQIALSANGTNHNWSGVDGYITGNNPAYVVLTPGETRTISVNATNACGQSGSDSVTLTANLNPSGASIDAGPSQICQNTESSTYVGSANNATAFTWLLSPNQAGTIDQNGTVTWNNNFAGVATITYRASNGCSASDTDTLDVTVTNEVVFYEDKDRDGYYIDTVLGCTNPNTAIYVTGATIIGPNDCDDDEVKINPETVWRLDSDGDNHAAPESNFVGCEPPSQNYDDYTFIIIPEDDCNDDNVTVFEITTWYYDEDNDGFYSTSTQSCDSPGPGYRNDDQLLPNDCDDTDPRVNLVRWFRDVDNDDLGDIEDEIREQCNEPSSGGPWVQNGNDPCPNDPDNLCGGGTPSTATGTNYVYTRTYQTERSGATPFFTSDEALLQNINYIDGLGRPSQQIALEHSPEIAGVKKDIVTFSSYDEFGRMANEWLPYAALPGTFGDPKTNVEQAVRTYYNNSKYENTENPFSAKEFESSPLNRVLWQAAPGNDWALGSGHEIKFSYQTNVDQDAVVLFTVDLVTTITNGVITYTPTLIESGNYLAGELFKNITYDENHSGTEKDHSTEEFTDKLGRVVLKRSYSNEIAHDTYYVYDDYGNLSYVLPPKVDISDGVSGIELSELCYQYTYDNRNRLVVKKLPGKEEEFVIYNTLDQPIMTQDANQRLKNEWLFTKYDAFGRVAYTGKALSSTGISRTDIQKEVNDWSGILWVTLQETALNLGGTQTFYNNTGYPTTSSVETQLSEILTINYYDAYIDGPTGAPASIVLLGTTNESNATSVKGLPTVSRVKVLDVSPEQWINTLTYYNNKGQAVYTYSENEYLGTLDVVETQLDYVGRPLKVRTAHTRDNQTIVTIDNFTYDHIGRLRSQTQCIGDETLGDTCGADNAAPTDPVIENETVTVSRSAASSITVSPVTTISGTVTLAIDPNASSGTSSSTELIVYNDYDELGQLHAKKVGGTPEASFQLTSGLQTIDYKYNVRGWLTDINDIDDLTESNGRDDLFAFKIRYNDPQNFGGNQNPTALFNGNIAQTFWKTASINNTGNPVSSRYSYSYDALNRITGAIDDTNDLNYSLTNVAYDKNGNIRALKRNGHTNMAVSTFGTMDDLTYDYAPSSNKLIKVSDAASMDQFGFKDDALNTDPDETDDYDYDQNGNLKSDTNKRITDIEYNYLNLPVSIAIDGGTIAYVYDAVGTKLKKVVSTGSNTEYSNGYIYENGQLQFFGQPEGYINSNGTQYDYVYQYTDHLGNVRLSYADSNKDGAIDASTEIISEKNYYPFGLTHKGYNNVVSPNATSQAEKYQYNGKELNEELGLNVYDYGARLYEPSLGRFMTVDKLADHLRQINRSPYAYSWNNPIYYNDPDGNCPQCISGAIVGAVLEILSQVGSSMLLDGLSFEESLEVLDGSDIAVEAGIGAISGALDGGASKLAKFLVKKKNRKLLAKLLGVGIDFTVDVVNSAAKNIFNAEDDVLSTDDIVEILISAGLGEFADEILPKVSTKKLDKKINKQTKKAENAKSKKKRKKAENKKKKAERAKAALDGVNSAASGTATSAATTGGKKVIDETKKEEND